jgi:hypothetical protein
VKNTIKVMGFTILVIIILLGAGTAVLAIIGTTLDKESKAYVDAAVPAIITEWDIAELVKRASPEFDEDADYEEIKQMFVMLQRLGKLEEYNGSAGDASITISFSGYEISAEYTAIADFETASAEIQISLIKHGRRWQILGFRIRPVSFSERNDII